MDKCIIVLGMHRSGASALMGVLNILGVNPGQDLMNPTKDNPVRWVCDKKIASIDQILF